MIDSGGGVGCFISVGGGGTGVCFGSGLVCDNGDNGCKVGGLYGCNGCCVADRVVRFCKVVAVVGSNGVLLECRKSCRIGSNMFATCRVSCSGNVLGMCSVGLSGFRFDGAAVRGSCYDRRAAGGCGEDFYFRWLVLDCSFVLVFSLLWWDEWREEGCGRGVGYWY